MFTSIVVAVYYLYDKNYVQSDKTNYLNRITLKNKQLLNEDLKRQEMNSAFTDSETRNNVINDSDDYKGYLATTNCKIDLRTNLYSIADNINEIPNGELVRVLFYSSRDKEYEIKYKNSFIWVNPASLAKPLIVNKTIEQPIKEIMIP